MSKKIVRDYLRKEILRFTKGKDLKEPWKIEKLVRYNDKEHPNEQGHDTGETSGMWKMGTTIRPSENGYTMIDWTIVQGKVEWNAEIQFNKKMTPMCGYINTFMGSPLVYNGERISKEYLLEYWSEMGDNWMSAENGFTFKQLFSVGGGVLEVEEVTESPEEIQLTEENAIQYVYDNTSKYDDWVKGSTVYQELEEENKKLKEKDKEWKASDKHLNKCIDSIRDQYLELKQENKKLKEENKQLQEYQDKWSVIIPSLAGDDWEDLLSDYGWTYDDDGEMVRHSDEEEEYSDDEVDYYIDAGRKAVLKDGRVVKSKEEEEEEDTVFLYPDDAGSIQDPEHPEDNYSFGNNSKSKIDDNYTMKRILKNGSIQDCVAAYAYCMFVKGGKLYYRGRSSSGPAHVRTIKGEKTTMEFPY